MKSSSQGSARKANSKTTASLSKKKAKGKVVEVELSASKPKKKAGAKKKASTKAAEKKASTKKASSKTSTKKTLASKKKSTSKKKAKTAASSKKKSAVAKKKEAQPKKKASAKNVAAKKASTKKTTSKKASTKAVSKKAATETKATKKKAPTKRKASAVKKPETKTSPRKKKAAAKNAKVVATNTEAELRAEEEKLRQNMISPSMASLKPFREAAKRNKAIRAAKEKARGKKSSFLARPPRKGKKYDIDLRIHTPASEGFFSTGGVDPAPALVRLARVKGLHAIAITDYNNAAYVDVLQELAEGSSLSLIPGLDLLCEVGGCDEVSIIALFPEEKSSADLFSILEQLNVPEWAHGRSDFVIRKPFAQVLHTIESAGGVVIPSRIDKTPFRKLAIPTLVEEFGIHSFDLVHPEAPEFFRSHWPDGGFNFFSFSNASALGQVGSRSAKVKLTEPGFAGIKELVARRVLN